MSAETEVQARQIGFEMFASRALNIDFFRGVTDPVTRKAHIRAALLFGHTSQKVLCDLQGWETWACRFERIYGEEL